MDDDIDIEEHDVLDNPKIRDIFPDLSLVKIEVTENTEYTEDQYEAPLRYEPDTDYVVNIKRENTSDEESDTAQHEQHDNHIPELGQSELDNQLEQTGANAEFAEFGQNDMSYEYEENEDISNELDQNDELNYSNKIILGSKPVPDYDTLYQEALHSKVSVALENWEYKLKNSICYCDECQILFPTVNTLDAHKSISHSFLVPLDTPRPNTARKSTTIASSRYCNHCDRIFTNDTALIKHLYELLPLNNFKKPTPEPLKIDAKSTRYKCTKCKKYFATFAAGKEHKKNVHPTLNNVNVICKVLAKAESSVTVKKELPDNTVTVKKDPDGRFFASNSLIPKSVLFQCHVCQINFVSCYSATQHSIRCRNSTEYQKCKTCKRKIRAKDSYLHTLQHRHALPGAKLKIYTLHTKMAEKVYLKCPKCSVCFDERTFWVHYGMCESQRLNYIRCNICNIDINHTRYPNHKSKHVMQKCTKKDFVIIKFYDLNQMNTEETTMQRNAVPTSFKAEKIPLYYCSICGSCKTYWSQRGHKSGACKNVGVRFCELCGLGFSKENYKQHRDHHMGRKLTLNDFKIINMRTGAEIEVPISNFHSCKRCKIHFLSSDRIQLHNCADEPFEFCEICNKKFNLRAFAPHSNFHTHSNIPELLKKYNSINDMWNVVYLCTACNLVTTTYDSAVEHSQNHISKFPKPLSKKCDVCDFDIIEPHYKIHAKLHKNKMMIDRTKFRILKFNYKELFSMEWMAMFSSLPKAHKYQILSKSVYRLSRRFKINCVINCNTDDIKLYCEKCKTGINLEDSKKHYFDKKCKFSKSYVCRTCNLHFSTLHDCVLHEKNHDTVTKIYKVITFNDQKDELFDQRLKDFELSVLSKAPVKSSTPAKSSKPSIKSGSQIKSSKSLIKYPIKVSKLGNRISKFNRTRFAKTVADEVLRAKRIKLYKCEKCGSCVSLMKNIAKHNCTMFLPSRHKLCPICKEYFYSRHLKLHMELHRQFSHLTKKPLVVRFKPSSNPESLPVANIFQCECGLHFTSKPSIESHLEICTQGLEISKETCSKCNLLFPTDVLVTHLCKHHSKPMDIRIQFIKNKETGPIKCADCNIVYTKITNYDEHLFTCGSKVGRRCSECNFKYESKSFASHECSPNQKVPVLKKSASITTVFRCLKCDISYLNRKTMSYHFLVNHVTCRDIVTCSICKLKFTSTSHSRHKLMHKNTENYIIKVVDPTTGRSSIFKGKNNQVSTSSSRRPKDDESVLDTSEAADIKNEGTEEVEKNTDDELAEAQAPVYKVYRCNQCDTCYRFKKRLENHMASNHVTKRDDLPCVICGLKFSSKLMRSHMTMIHENGSSEYNIEVYEYGTGNKTVVKGKNNPLNTSKAPSASVKRGPSEHLNLRSKRTRRNYYNMQNMTDENIDSQDEEPSTSKYGFESVDLAEGDKETTLTDADNEDNTDSINVSNDPLNANNSIEPDTETGDNTCATKKAKLATSLSDRMMNMLNANMGKYSSTLYKCRFCSLHFLKEGSIIWHLTRNHNRTFDTNICDICGLGFTHATLRRHLFVHHTRMKLDKNSFNIQVFDENTLKNPPLISLPPDAEAILPDDNITEEIDPPNAETGNATVTSNAKIYYYKCGDCNVCFIEENTCRKHCISHTELDPKTYIECKICNFQFLIDSLKRHVTVHHVEEFFLEDLVVTEYNSSIDGNPKIEIYQGIDKVQSRLISTTTDVTDTSEKDIVGI